MMNMPTNPALSPSGPRPSDRWIPYYFFAFFGILVLVLVPMCILAVRTSPGVVTDRAYEKGLTYNDAIQANVAQQALHWQSHIDVTPAATGSMAIRFTLRDAHDQPIHGADVRMILSRPTQAGLDQQSALTETADGVYATTLTAQSGVWDVQISATYNQHNYQVSKRITAP